MCVIIVESASPIWRICRFCTIAALGALPRLSICECNKTAYKSLSFKANLDMQLDSDFVVLALSNTTGDSREDVLAISVRYKNRA